MIPKDTMDAWFNIEWDLAAQDAIKEPQSKVALAAAKCQEDVVRLLFNPPRESEGPEGMTERVKTLTSIARTFADVVNENVPDGDDKLSILRSVRLAWCAWGEVSCLTLLLHQEFTKDLSKDQIGSQISMVTEIADTEFRKAIWLSLGAIASGAKS
jgi:hypothetical protein